jgi:two-component system, chemotaxis family, protein-glutamate methylesterase/glutaminase
MSKIRILVVDDSLFMRKVITDILQSDPGLEVVGDASDGARALQKIEELRPQVVTLDYEMPHLDGLQTLKKIVEKPTHPAVIIVSGYVEQGADVTLRFLEAGALDFVLKPSGTLSLDMAKVKDELIEKVKIAAQVDPRKHVVRVRGVANRKLGFTKQEGVVVVGASTGGPAALQVLLPQFPAHFPLPIVVAQHLPRLFATSFTTRLGAECLLKVVEAEDGMPLVPGVIYVVPGGTDTTITRAPDQAVFSVQDNTVDIETPSVTALMSSAAAVYGSDTIGVILTGMGKDGAVGMEAIKGQGGKTLVQDESTSVVFGMGREVVERGFADDIVPLDAIVEKIGQILN